MCKALEEWEEECRNEAAIMATVKTCKKFNIPQEAAFTQIQTEYNLDPQDAWNLMQKYWAEFP